MEHILQPVDVTTSLFVYRDGEKFACTDYEKLHNLLAESLFESEQDQRLTIDWTTVPTHPLIFEIPLTAKTDQNTFDFLMRFFETVFLQVFRKYVHVPEVTMILAMGRQQTSGLRIYVVGMEVAHDDYIYLCHLMRDACAYQEKDLSVYLNIPSQFPLPSSNRPKEIADLYRPVRLVRVQLKFEQWHDEWHTHCLQNNVVIQQEDQDSVFSEIANYPSRWKVMVSDMMPLPQPNATYLHFPTHIVSQTSQKKDALIMSYLNAANTYRIVKERTLVEGKPFFYDFLKENSPHIKLDLLKNNLALSTWYKQFGKTDSPLDYFKWIDLKLKQQCPHLKDEPSPLTAVLKAYERPVYYALIHLLKDKRDVYKIQQDFPFLASDLPVVPPPEASYVSFDTILHCAYLTGEGSLISHLGDGYEWILSTISSLSELKEHVLWIQKKLFPVAQDLDHVYAWNKDIAVWEKLTEPVLDMQDRLRWSMETLNMYYDLPSDLMKSFQEEMLETVARETLVTAKTVQGHAMMGPEEVYGKNVPEYYFFSTGV